MLHIILVVIFMGIFSGIVKGVYVECVRSQFMKIRAAERNFTKGSGVTVCKLPEHTRSSIIYTVSY